MKDTQKDPKIFKSLTNPRSLSSPQDAQNLFASKKRYWRRYKDDFDFMSRSKVEMCRVTSRKNPFNNRPVKERPKTSTNKTSFFMSERSNMRPLKKLKRPSNKAKRQSTFANSFTQDHIPTCDVLEGFRRKEKKKVIDIRNMESMISEPISLLIQNMCDFDMCNQLSQLTCDNRVGSFTGCGINFCEEHAKFILEYCDEY